MSKKSKRYSNIFEKSRKQNNPTISIVPQVKKTQKTKKQKQTKTKNAISEKTKTMQKQQNNESKKK